MKNNIHNKFKVKTVCENKLIIKFRDGGEFNGWFIHEGTKIARITIPHGREFLPKGTYKSMARQLKLTIDEFDSLLDCPLKKDQYIEILMEQGII